MSQRLYEGMSLREITEFLFVEDEPQIADLIIVFGGKRPERANRAAALFNQGFAPRILVTGGDKRGTGQAEAEEIQKGLLAQGVPPEAVITESRSLRTLENVLMTVPLVDQLIGWTKMNGVILVSSPHHMRRVKQTLARHIPRDVTIYCCPDHRADITRDNWWQSEDGRNLVFRELEKVRTYAHQGEL